MSRGGRRRKGKRGRRGPSTGEHRAGTGQETLEEREGQPSSRRRSQSRGSAREVSVLEQMSSLPTTLKTLPPDGTDLDQLIGALQSEYGVPATPQEYRLIIKVPAPEEHLTDPSLEVKPAPADSRAEPEPEAAATPRQRPARRRRRGRRRTGGGTAVADTGDSGEAEAPGPAVGEDSED